MYGLFLLETFHTLHYNIESKSMHYRKETITKPPFVLLLWPLLKGQYDLILGSNLGTKFLAPNVS